MTGTLILSLDFELMWGVRDHRSVADYGDVVLGARAAIPEMLLRFQRSGIRATWATVGFLFARNRDELLDHAPPVHLRPRYGNPHLSPYDFIASGLGRGERDDPWHFGRSLLDRVAETEGQEIATHTFSHFYCLEPGGTVDQFSADLSSAVSIAQAAGHRLRSIVFPRNQMTPHHIAAAVAQGISVYRGNPGSFAYRSRPGRDNTALVRALRLADGVLPLFPRLTFPEPKRRYGATDVPASRFLRPYIRRAPLYSSLHLARIAAEMTEAAREDRCYHLWWHPHNMGRNLEANLAQLDSVVATYRKLQNMYGISSRNMSDVG